MTWLLRLWFESVVMAARPVLDHAFSASSVVTYGWLGVSAPELCGGVMIGVCCVVCCVAPLFESTVCRTRQPPIPPHACRWTDRAAGLLRACASHLAGRLTSLDMGSCRLSTSEVWDALGHLTHLRQLGMSVYNNSDTHLLCELAALSRLATLHSLSLTKQRAYFPVGGRYRGRVLLARASLC